MLSYFSFNLPFVLICDASDKALGTCLAHVIDGIEKPIVYNKNNNNNKRHIYHVL